MCWFECQSCVTYVQTYIHTTLLVLCFNYTKWFASLNHHKCNSVYCNVETQKWFTIPPNHILLAQYSSITLYTIPNSADANILKAPFDWFNHLCVALLFSNAIWYAQICLNYITVKYNIQPNHVQLNFHSVLLNTVCIISF